MDFFFHTAVGKITMVGTVPESMVGLQTPPQGEFMVVGKAVLLESYYDIEAEEVKALKRQDTHLDGFILRNLPNPCVVTYTSAGFSMTNEVSDGEVEFTTDVIGEHRIKVTAFPYLDWEGTFNAV